jgi:Zn-dependent M28 family amino/carboxypeptidase
VTPDPDPEKGTYFRSDHFSFVKAGVPALYTKSGTSAIGKPDGWMQDQMADFTSTRYHKPADEIDDTWNLTGMADDLRVLLRVGYTLANTSEFPSWYERSAFSR